MKQQEIGQPWQIGELRQHHITEVSTGTKSDADALT